MAGLFDSITTSLGFGTLTMTGRTNTTRVTTAAVFCGTTIMGSAVSPSRRVGGVWVFEKLDMLKIRPSILTLYLFPGLLKNRNLQGFLLLTSTAGP